MGNVIQTVDTNDYQEIVEKVTNHLEEESRQAENLAESASFNMVYLAKKYDDWLLDPIVGFIIPGFGDMISSLAILPALYVAIFKLRSIRLTLAIFTSAVIDMLIGFIPALGDIIDVFYKTNRMACRLIVGYVEQDEDILHEINKRAVWGVILMVIMAFLVYTCYTLVLGLYNWIVGLF